MNKEKAPEPHRKRVIAPEGGIMVMPSLETHGRERLRPSVSNVNLRNSLLRSRSATHPNEFHHSPEIKRRSGANENGHESYEAQSFARRQQAAGTMRRPPPLPPKRVGGTMLRGTPNPTLAPSQFMTPPRRLPQPPVRPLPQPSTRTQHALDKQEKRQSSGNRLCKDKQQTNSS